MSDIEKARKLCARIEAVCAHERTDVVLAAMSAMIETKMRAVCAATGRDYAEWVREYADMMLIDANAPVS